MMDAGALCARHEKIHDGETEWQRLIDDCYRYVMPYRERANTERKGEKAHGRTERVFDATAVVGAMRGSSRLQKGLTPFFQKWFNLVPGPLAENAGDTDAMKRQLHDVSKMALATFQQGGFQQSAPEFYQDLFAGEGSMMVVRGTPDELVKFITIPADRIQHEDDNCGRTVRWYYPCEFTKKEFTADYPAAKLPSDLEKQFVEAEEKGDRVTILLTCERLAPRKFEFKVIWKKAKQELHREVLRSSPFITARFFKVPAQARGRGPLMLAMPHIKTLNKSMEMSLKAAAFAILGVWMTSDSGVFNPNTLNLVPGGLIPVQRTASNYQGPSLQRLNIPDNFDLSAIVNQDLRSQIREMLLDYGLPEASESVKSPTEIVQRLKRLAEDIASAFGRLQMEFIIPLVQRVLDILHDWGLLQTNLTIDQLLLQVQVISPLADAQMLDEVEKAVQWFSIMAQTIGPDEARINVSDEFGGWLHKNLNVDPDAQRPAEEQAPLRQQMREAAMAAFNEQGAAAA